MNNISDYDLCRQVAIKVMGWHEDESGDGSWSDHLNNLVFVPGGFNPISNANHWMWIFDKIPWGNMEISKQRIRRHDGKIKDIWSIKCEPWPFKIQSWYLLKTGLELKDIGREICLFALKIVDSNKN